MRAPALAALLLALGACSSEPRPGDPAPRRGDEISVCGQLFHTGARVVLWNDPGGYDAYRVVPRFPRPRAPDLPPAAEATAPASAATAPAGATSRPDTGTAPGPTDEPEEKARYGPRRPRDPEMAARVARDSWRLEDLQQVVHQFVLHYDVAGTARQCFKVLQDMRGLSVHFLLDVDGTIYQTLDLKERAWHATVANEVAVGIEIAHIGAYPQPGHPVLRSWYDDDAQGPRVTFPKWIQDTGIRTEGFVARPARKELVAGRIHDREWHMYDFTEEQYRALARLTAALHRVLPRIRLEAPRAPDGGVLATTLSPEALRSFEGVLGHYHVQRNKQDPGPAFQWERVLREARTLAR
ncbi:MAG: N-acetylmuramoyl-L-alanine amidase [Planctomycetes bacterium]|nr:N-acetylmuramoyl-L-alanine amidase [Planctomycetota bacterium]